MNQDEFIQHTLATLERLGIPYAVVGSAGSTAYGEPRATQDLDIVIDLPRRSITSLCAAFPHPEMYVSEPAARDAVHQRRQFNVIHVRSAFKIDFLIVKDTAWSQTQIARRRVLRIFGGHRAYVAAPEDVILGKLQYYREGGSDKHIRDITSMLDVSGDQIDREDIARWAEALGVLDLWLKILTAIEMPPPAAEQPPF